jgi:two-component system OmpR family response regulator
MSRPRILLVDDNAEFLTLLARLVEAEGWEAVTAPRARAGVDAIAAGRIDAAAIDVLLPDMMGYEVGAAARAQGIPFVFMTGVFKGGRAATEARAQHGAAGYFEKPFPGKKLVDALRDLLPSRPRTRAPAAPEPEVTEDFDVQVAVEADEPSDALELTGRVVLTEGGKVSAVLRGETVTAAPLGTPGQPPPAVHPPHRTAAQVHAETVERKAAAAAAAALAPPQATPTGPGTAIGKLEENLPELITAFWLTEQTGELTLQKGKVKKTIFFDAGRPVFAISNLLNDRFGPFLVRIGKITPGQLELVQAAADRTRRRTGDILVEMQLLKETEKLYYVAQQVKAIVYSLFGWEEGEFRLHFDDRASKEAIKLDLHPANLIMRGVKKLYKPERLFRLLSPEDRLIPTPQPAYGLHEVELEKWEGELLARIDGTRTLAELIHMAQRPEHLVYGYLYGLTALKILERR